MTGGSRGIAPAGERCFAMTLSAKVFFVQVLPFRVHAVDEVDLLFARTGLDLLFSKDGCVYIAAAFEVDQLGDIVLAGKFTSLAGLVFKDSPLEVICDACV
jgi:hypothetical protein